MNCLGAAHLAVFLQVVKEPKASSNWKDFRIKIRVNLKEITKGQKRKSG